METSNFLTVEELQGIINLIDALDNVDKHDVSFSVKLFDANGDEIGHIEQKAAGSVYYPNE